MKALRIAAPTLLAATPVFLAAESAGIRARPMAVALLAVSLAVLVGPRPTESPRHTKPIARALVVLLALVWLMALPLPLSLTRLLGPQRHQHNLTAARRIAQVERLELLEPQPRAFALSRNRAGTLRVAGLLTLAGAAAVTASRLTPAARLFVLRALLGLGGFMGVAGFLSLRLYPQGDTLWWILPIEHVLPGPVACFINRNHFGGFLALLLPVGLVLLTDAIPRRRWAGIATASLCIAAMTGAILVSLSRGAMVAAAAAVVGLPCFYWARHGRRRAALGLGLAGLLLAAAIPLADSAIRANLATLRNPAETASFQVRAGVWNESLRIAAHYPLLGAGPNAFRMVYPQHRHSSERAFRTHAENQYIETLTDFGLIGTAVLAWCLLAAGRGVWKGTHAFANETAVMAALGAGVASAVHGLVDFPHFVPLYALTLGTLVGLALPPLPEGHGRFPLLSVLLVAGAALLALWARPIHERDHPAALYRAPLADTTRAIVWAPTSRHAWYYAGRRLWAVGTPEARRLGERFVTQAAAYDPHAYPLHHALGRMRLRLKDYAGAREAFERVRALRAWVPIPRIPGNKAL